MQITGAGTQICCTSGDTWGTMAFLFPFPQLYISLDTIAERLAHSQAGASHVRASFSFDSSYKS